MDSDQPGTSGVYWTCPDCSLEFPSHNTLLNHYQATSHGRYVPPVATTSLTRTPVTASITTAETGTQTILAIANDGTLWLADYSTTRGCWDPWTRMADLPQGDGVERPGQRRNSPTIPPHAYTPRPDGLCDLCGLRGGAHAIGAHPSPERTD